MLVSNQKKMWRCMLCFRWGRGEIVKLLVGRFGQDPNLRTRGGYTPLMIAGIWKHHEVVWKENLFSIII